MARLLVQGGGALNPHTRFSPRRPGQSWNGEERHHLLRRPNRVGWRFRCAVFLCCNKTSPPQVPEICFPCLNIGRSFAELERLGSRCLSAGPPWKGLPSSLSSDLFPSLVDFPQPLLSTLSHSPPLFIFAPSQPVQESTSFDQLLNGARSPVVNLTATFIARRLILQLNPKMKITVLVLICAVAVFLWPRGTTVEDIVSIGQGCAKVSGLPFLNRSDRC